MLERACQDLPDHSIESISRTAKNRVHDGQTKQAIDSFEATVRTMGVGRSQPNLMRICGILVERTVVGPLVPKVSVIMSVGVLALSTLYDT